MLPTRLIPIYILEFCFWVYVGWSWLRWHKSHADSAIAKWRRIIIAVGFGFATLSTGLDIFMTVHAAVTGGYPFYRPVEMFCVRTGTLASVLVLLTVIVGTGKLRVPTAIASSITLFLWFADAMSQ